MSIRRLFLFLLVATAFLITTGIPTESNPGSDDELVAGRNVNMVAGTEFPTYPDGDPYLQRQNEPSMAVSTRNPLHLLAGANDYRGVDYVDEGGLPGQEPAAGQTGGDAWLGVFKSFNGGQTWTSTLLPGCKFNPNDPRTSLIYGYGASADPTVRAGANGMFYYSGIAFDRIENGRSVLFVARYMDINTTQIGDPDPIRYIDTSIIDEGTSGQFADKPWIAVDIPRNTPLVPIIDPDIPYQEIPAHNVYITYSIFLGDLGTENVHNKILFARSTDCATTFEHPTKLSEGQQVNQGTIIAISPADGTIYVAWRRFKEKNTDPSNVKQPDAILVCKSDDFGNSFNKPVEVDLINPFDQGTSDLSFRTSAMPAMTVDNEGIVYVAWSDTRYTSPFARIVISTSKDGINWSVPEPIDNHEGLLGHQIMPSLTFAAGKLMATWYDTRNSPLNYTEFIFGEDQTMDVRAAKANPIDSDYWIDFPNPIFSDSVQVSRYLYKAEIDVSGDLVIPVQLEQVTFDEPIYKMFMGGKVPFHGDYIDITPAPQILFDVPDLNNQENGHWRFNTGEEAWDPDIFHVTWTDNRDVIPPSEGLNWTDYLAPIPPCDNDTTGMRNQNIYTATISQDIIIGSPVNTKPLRAPLPPQELQTSNEPFVQKRTFLIFLKNLTYVPRDFRLTIEAPTGMDASFWEFGTPEDQDPPELCPLLLCGYDSVVLPIEPHSSTTLTVFVAPYTANPYATFRIKVEEVELVEVTNNIWDLLEGGFQGYITLNPDPINTQTIPVTPEYHTPNIVKIENPLTWILEDPTILSGTVEYTSESLDELFNFSNPDIVAPSIRSPSIRSYNIVNPSIRSPSIRSIPEGTVTDIQWKVTNDTNITSAYSFDPIGELPDPDEDVEYQLLIYRVNTSPLSENCAVIEEEHHELLLKVESPSIRSPSIRSPSIRSPSIRSNTFFLAPGETAICALRLIDPTPNPFDPEDYTKTVVAAAIPQAANPDGNIDAAAFLWINTISLPDGSVNDPYPPTQLEAQEGQASYTWSKYQGLLPDGLELTSGGLLKTTAGTLKFDPPYDYDKDNDIYKRTYDIMVKVADASLPSPQEAYRNLSITVYCQFYTITADAGEGEGDNFVPYKNGLGPGGSISPAGLIEKVHQGDLRIFNITHDSCYRLDVIVDAIPDGEKLTHTFTDVRRNHTIRALFEIKTYTITADAGYVEGGTFHPYLEGDVIGGSISQEGVGTDVPCGSTRTFTATAEPCYHIHSIKVNHDYLNIPPEQLQSHTFEITVKKDYTIEAAFALSTYPINAQAGEVDDEGNFVEGKGGSISPAGLTPGVPCGSSMTFTIIPDIGYQLVDVVVDDEPVMGDVFIENDESEEPTFSYILYVSKDHTITAKFKNLEDWARRYNNKSVNGNDEANDIVFDDYSGNIIVTGHSLGSPTGPDFYTISYDSAGNVSFDARYDGPAQKGDYANALVVDDFGNFSTTGSSFRGTPNNPDRHSDYCTVKYNSSGEEVWDVRYDARRNGEDVATAIAADAKGNVYVTGRSQVSLSKKSDVLHYDYLTTKYESNRGRMVWEARYNNAPVNGNDEAVALVVDSTGNVYATGRSARTSSTNADFDYATVWYNKDGKEPKVVRYNNESENGDDEATAIALSKNGFIYVTGKSQGGSTGYDFCTIKYDSSLREIDLARYDGEYGHDWATAIAVDSEGNVYVAGKSEGNPAGFDYVIVKYDAYLKEEWVARYNNASVGGIDEATAIAVDDSGNVYVTGKSQGDGTSFDFLTIKYDSTGNIIWRARYNNSDNDANGEDVATAIVVDSEGNVYVTGKSARTNTDPIDFDFATVKYKQN